MSTEHAERENSKLHVETEPTFLIRASSPHNFQALATFCFGHRHVPANLGREGSMVGSWYRLLLRTGAHAAISRWQEGRLLGPVDSDHNIVLIREGRKLQVTSRCRDEVTPLGWSTDGGYRPCFGRPRA